MSNLYQKVTYHVDSGYFSFCFCESDKIPTHLFHTIFEMGISTETDPEFRVIDLYAKRESFSRSEAKDILNAIALKDFGVA